MYFETCTGALLCQKASQATAMNVQVKKKH